MNNIEIKIYLYGSWQIQSWNQTGILLYYRNKEKFSEYNLRDECVNEISDSVFIYKNLYQTILKTDIVRGIPLFYGFNPHCSINPARV